jgi:hypothetical protein
MAGRFHGKRMYAIDGSSFKTPDTPENDNTYGRPGTARGRAGYPQMRAVLLVDLGARIVVAEKHGAFKTSEIELAREVVKELPPGSLSLLDRNFYSTDLLYDVREGGRDFVVRIKANTRVRKLQKLGAGDWLVEVDVPWKARDKRPDLPRVMRLRLIEYTPPGGTEKIRLLTSLLNAVQVKAAEIANLYHERWGIETVVDEIKTHLCGCQTVDRAVFFRSKTPERIEQEWYGILLAYNAVRRVISVAAARTRAAPVRLSFTAALERLRDTLNEMLRLPTWRLPACYERMMKQIARNTVPSRPWRKNARVVKIKLSQYPVKRKRSA